MAAPLRSEIDNEFKWAVNDIYSSDNAWEEDYQKLIKQAGEPWIGKTRMSKALKLPGIG